MREIGSAIFQSMSANMIVTFFRRRLRKRDSIKGNVQRKKMCIGIRSMVRFGMNSIGIINGLPMTQVMYTLAL